MRARPGRVLPTVIVGGVLISGLALGAGTAWADGECTIGVATLSIPVEVTGVSAGADGACTKGGQPLTLADALSSGLVPVTTTSTTSSVTPTTGAGPTTAASAAAVSSAPTSSAAVTTTTKAGAAVSTTTAVPTPAPLAAAALPAVAPALAAGPTGALPALVGSAPAGLASSLFTADSYDPGLLFGSLPAGAAGSLFTAKSAGDVTTVSQAEVLASPAGAGYGTPVTIGVIILACLVGFAVRHRVISRMKTRDLPAEYVPRHATVDAEESARGDETGSLVVLTRRSHDRSVRAD